ncbi:MAG: OmpA family protein [Verrucomicrobiales bacterium]|jgi:peptidoglycan-associated lipoprotein|nr:OmpA family protein [Verrucomicrobiales bacterium]
MKKHICLFAAALTISLTACSTDHKKIDGNGGVTGYETEALPDGGFAQHERIPGLNPDDADYGTLAAHVVHFDFDSFTVRVSERPKLEFIAKWLAANPGVKLVIAGHTDSRGTVQYNVALGERRALATRDYLLGLGADAAVLTTISYGKEHPARHGENEGAWAANRRAEFGVAR